ncbi:hypothetical protein BaRGS_00030118 [Batillaria attramentaria]|uniref:Uncharacterized protein n=1 Tax=Batillaria attramentaria TaxID=370345 RepID=A0ABD0JU75_9CAEN
MFRLTTVTAETQHNKQPARNQHFNQTRLSDCVPVFGTPMPTENCGRVLHTERSAGIKAKSELYTSVIRVSLYNQSQTVGDERAETLTTRESPSRFEVELQLTAL